MYLTESVLSAENQSESAVPALHSFNTKRQLKNSLAISFNVSLPAGRQDIIRYAMLRIYREPAAWDLLEHNCSNVSDLSLQLYTQMSTEGGNPVFSLRGVQPLSQADFEEGEWVEFLNLTSMYKSLIESSVRDEGVAVLHARLTVGSPTCSSLSPSDLGVVSIGNHRAQLVGFEEVQKDSSGLLSHLVEHLARIKRQAEEEGSSNEEGLDSLSTEAPPSSNSATFEVPTEGPTLPFSNTPLDNPTNYRYSRCQLYNQHVSQLLEYSVQWNL